MSSTRETVKDLIGSGYEHGFVTDIESDTVAPGLDEDTIRLISARKNEPDWMLEARRCAGAETQELTDAFATAAMDLPWGQNYDDDDFGPGFRERYGFMELLGPRGPLQASDIASKQA